MNPLPVFSFERGIGPEQTHIDEQPMCRSYEEGGISQRCHKGQEQCTSQLTGTAMCGILPLDLWPVLAA